MLFPTHFLHHLHATKILHLWYVKSTEKLEPRKPTSFTLITAIFSLTPFCLHSFLPTRGDRSSVLERQRRRGKIQGWGGEGDGRHWKGPYEEEEVSSLFRGCSRRLCVLLRPWQFRSVISTCSSPVTTGWGKQVLHFASSGTASGARSPSSAYF